MFKHTSLQFDSRFFDNRENPMVASSRDLMIALEVDAGDKPYSLASTAELGLFTGHKVRSVQVMLQELARSGWIQTVAKGNGTNRIGLILLKRATVNTPFAATTADRIRAERAIRHLSEVR